MRLVKPSTFLIGISTTFSSFDVPARSPLSSSMGASSHLRRTLSPASPDFSGWNWQARMLPLRMEETNVSSPYWVVVFVHAPSTGVGR